MAGVKGRSGPRRKPDGLLLLQGGFRQDRHGDPNRAKAAASKRRRTPIPNPPPWLDKEAAAEFRRVARLLVAASVLDATHVQVLAAYAHAAAEFRHYVEMTNSLGRFTIGAKNRFMPAPWVRQASAAALRMRQFAVELGLTPSSQASVGGGAGGGKPKKSSVGDLLNRGAAVKGG